MSAVSDIERLTAIDEIKKLKARRDRSVDLRDWDTYLALHAPDHKSHNDGYEPWTREDMVHHLRVDLAHVEIIHLSHTPDITVHSKNDASGIWYLEDQHYWKQGEAEHRLQGFGWYHENYALRDGKWLFVSRRIERVRVMATPGAEHPVKTAALRTGHYKGDL